MILVFSRIGNAQISGQLFQYESEFPLAKVSIRGESKSVESDFDGNFTIEIDENLKSIDLIIDSNQDQTDKSFKALKVVIQNLKLDNETQLELGKIELPSFKSIEIYEFEKLSKSEKENCYPIYCWTQLLGYTFTNKLENDYLTLNCKNKITEFEYNPVTKTVSVDWNSIKDCE